MTWMLMGVGNGRVALALEGGVGGGGGGVSSPYIYFTVCTYLMLECIIAQYQNFITWIQADIPC